MTIVVVESLQNKTQSKPKNGGEARTTLWLLVSFVKKKRTKKGKKMSNKTDAEKSKAYRVGIWLGVTLLVFSAAIVLGLLFRIVRLVWGF